MRKLIVFALLLVAASGSGQGFRGFSWGASPQEVLKIEGAGSISDRGMGLLEITYQFKKVLEHTADITFTFGRNGLVWGEYHLPDEMARFSLFMFLSDKYGAPEKSKRVGEAFDVEVWITSDGKTRIVLATVIGQHSLPFDDEVTKANRKSVRLRYYDEETWGPHNAKDLGKRERPEL
ncbi:hypothetical protein ES708_25818 [subsurface metagenome]